MTVPNYQLKSEDRLMFKSTAQEMIILLKDYEMGLDETDPDQVGEVKIVKSLRSFSTCLIWALEDLEKAQGEIEHLGKLMHLESHIQKQSVSEDESQKRGYTQTLLNRIERDSLYLKNILSETQAPGPSALEVIGQMAMKGLAGN
jgi:hypothetical protein